MLSDHRINGCFILVNDFLERVQDRFRPLFGISDHLDDQRCVVLVNADGHNSFFIVGNRIFTGQVRIAPVPDDLVDVHPAQNRLIGIEDRRSIVGILEIELRRNLIPGVHVICNRLGIDVIGIDKQQNRVILIFALNLDLSGQVVNFRLQQILFRGIGLHLRLIFLIAGSHGLRAGAFLVLLQTKKAAQQNADNQHDNDNGPVASNHCPEQVFQIQLNNVAIGVGSIVFIHRVHISFLEIIMQILPQNPHLRKSAPVSLRLRL